jgi:hypothetical protein
MIDRDELGRKVMEAAQACAEGYTRGVNEDQDVNKKCAIAASNTGWFILEALGFSNKEKRALFNAYQNAYQRSEEISLSCPLMNR